MKIRNGFVSNSSSSSFIMIFDESKNIDCSICKELFKSFFDIIGTAEEVIIQQYSYSNIEEYKENVYQPENDLLIKAHNNNLKVAYKSVEYGNEDVANVVVKIAENINAEYEWDS
jgi:hypothetical protein